MPEEFIVSGLLDRPRLLGGSGPTQVTGLLEVRPNPSVLGGLLEGLPQRQPTHLVLVIDVSGSMRWKLHREDASSRRRIDIIADAAHKLLGRLGPADRMSIVRYDHAARTLARVVAGSDRGTLEEGLRQLRDDGGGRTVMASGLQAVHDELLHDPATPPARVLVLTDGSDDQPAAAVAHAARLGERRVRVDAVGVGEYRHGFLFELTRVSGGTAHRITTEQTAGPIFDQILAGAQDAIAVNVSLECWVTPEVLLGEVYRTKPDVLFLADATTDAKNILRIPIGQIGRAERLQFVLGFEVPIRPAGARLRIAKAVLRYDVPALGVRSGEASANLVVELTADATAAQERSGEVFHVARRARIQRQVLEVDRLAGRAKSGTLADRDRRLLAKLLQAIISQYREMSDHVSASLFENLFLELQRSGSISLDSLNASLAASSRAEDANDVSQPTMLDF